MFIPSSPQYQDLSPRNQPSVTGSLWTDRLLWLPLVFFTALFLSFPAPPSPCEPVTTASGETGPPRPGATSHPSLEHAKNLITSHQEAAAVVALKNFLASSPRPQEVEEASVLMAIALMGLKEHTEAVTYLTQFLSEFPNSALAGRARLLLGQAYLELGNLDAALRVLLEVRTLETPPETKQQALKLIGDIQARKGELVRAIQAWREEMALAPEEERAEVHARIQGLVERMDARGLLRLRDTYPAEFPGDLALIRLIELQRTRGEEHLAERYARLFLHRFPTHPYAPTASELLHSFQARLKTSHHVLAAVLPLSGRLQGFGLESLNGIQIALEKGREMLGVESIGLKIIDSETDRTVLQSELHDVLAEYRPLAVIGPLLSRDLQSVASLAEHMETPFITPAATLADVRRLGAYLFSTALTYPLQVQHLVEHAMAQFGYRRFCILHPDTAYGREMAALFAQEVQKRAGEIIAIESYKETDTDFGAQIRRIKEVDLKHHGQTTTTKTSKGAVRIMYTPGFDAVFIPGDALQVALIRPQLVFHDIKVPLLGTNTWNTSDLLRLANHSLDGSLFVDGFFVDSPNPSIRDFVERYRRRYQSDPTLFSAQAYDAARIVLEAIRKGATSGRAVREQLLKASDLPTLAGPGSFGPGGVLNRRLFVIYVKNGKLAQMN